MNKRIYLCLAHMSGKEQSFIKEAFDTNWVVPLGPNVNGFEKDLQDFFNDSGEMINDSEPTKQVVALSAGTAAIHLGLIQLGVQPGDEVICQSFTFCASANPVNYCGATPVFVDIRPDTMNIDEKKIEAAITDKTVGIVPVHYAGVSCEMDTIMDIAKRHDLWVLRMRRRELCQLTKGKHWELLESLAVFHSTRPRTIAWVKVEQF